MISVFFFSLFLFISFFSVEWYLRDKLVIGFYFYFWPGLIVRLIGLRALLVWLGGWLVWALFPFLFFPFCMYVFSTPTHPSFSRFFPFTSPLWHLCHFFYTFLQNGVWDLRLDWMEG